MDITPHQHHFMMVLTGAKKMYLETPQDPNQQTGLALSKPLGEKPEGSPPATGPGGMRARLPHHTTRLPSPTTESACEQAWTSHLWFPSLSPLQTCTRVTHIPNSGCEVHTLQHWAPQTTVPPWGSGRTGGSISMLHVSKHPKWWEGDMGHKTMPFISW